MINVVGCKGVFITRACYRNDSRDVQLYAYDANQK